SKNSEDLLIKKTTAAPYEDEGAQPFNFQHRGLTDMELHHPGSFSLLRHLLFCDGDAMKHLQPVLAIMAPPYPYSVQALCSVSLSDRREMVFLRSFLQQNIS